jgi:diguanylate cyclase (GGDEF)-like protein
MKSINSRILTFAVLATLIPSIGLGLLSFWRHQAVISDNVSHELRSLAADSSSELTMWLRERVNEVRTLSTAYVLTDGLTPGMVPPPGHTRIGPAQVKLYLGSVQKKLEPILELTVTDAAGRIVASSGATPAPIALPTNWPNSAITEGVVVEPPRWNDTRATATLTVAVPVLSMHNELLGALSAVLDLGTIKPRLRELARMASAEVIVLAPDGEPVLGTQPAQSAPLPLAKEPLARLRAHLREAVSLDGDPGREVVAVAAAPSSLPVIVVAQRDRADIFAAWLRLLEVFVLLTAALTLFVALVAYWMGRSIVRPLNSLIAAADGIARGDLSVELRDAPPGEIGHLTRVFNLMTDRLRRSRAEVMAANQALQTQNRLLETLAVTDSLTGLYNRKRLDDILAEQFARFRRNRRPFAVLMLDLDYFKSINDKHGHVAGDQVLADVAAILKQSIRSIDSAARYGGEEFVLVLVETPLDAAVDIAQRIRSVVEHRPDGATAEQIPITVSLGVAHSREEDAGPEQVLARADEALYRAKRNGRNRVEYAT